MTALEIAKRILADLEHPEVTGQHSLWTMHYDKGTAVLDYSPVTVEELKALCEAIAQPVEVDEI